MRIQLQPGIKSDPVEYRYSYEWLFRLMEQERISHLQLDTFFELFQLPDAWFAGRDQARRGWANPHRIVRGV